MRGRQQWLGGNIAWRVAQAIRDGMLSKGAFLNQELPSRKDKIEAERQATIARMEELDPDLVAKWKREGML
jgi:hypothetical protein